MSVQPTDIAIILVSLAACGYCFVLSRRLKALQDTRDGLGATIMALSKSISAMSATTQETRAHAGELATRLSKLLDEADRMCARISDLNASMESTHATALEQVNAAHGELSTSMRDMLEESRDRIVEMSAMMRQMRTLMPEEGMARSDSYLQGGEPVSAGGKSRFSYEY